MFVVDMRHIFTDQLMSGWMFSLKTLVPAGGSTILLYASKFKEVHTIVNASGRLDLKEGLDNVLGADFLEKIEAGPLDVKDKSGSFSSVLRFFFYKMITWCTAVEGL